MDSPPGDRPPLPRESLEVRTLRLGGAFLYDRTEEPALVGVRTIWRLRVDFSLFAELSDWSDAVRSISARRCLTTERWSRLRIDGLFERLGGGGVRKLDFEGVKTDGTEGGGVKFGTGGSYNSNFARSDCAGLGGGTAGSSCSTLYMLYTDGRIELCLVGDSNRSSSGAGKRLG